MPAPSAVVTFTDADGDEFPIRIPTTPGETEDELTAVAERQLRWYVYCGDVTTYAPWCSSVAYLDA